MADEDASAIKFLVRSPDTGVSAYPWRLWWGRTSFYLKPLNKELSGRKFSFHGPDERHPRPGYSFGPDGGGSTTPVHEAATGWFVGRAWFPGRPINKRVSHVVRIRVAWDMFLRGSPSAVLPNMDLKKREEGAVIPPPTLLRAVDLDLYVCEGRPYWPNEKKARLDNAALGPLQNQANQYVTAVAVNRSIITTPTPADVTAPPPKSQEDRLRGLGFSVDPTGFIWVVEQWMGRETFDAVAVADDDAATRNAE